MLGSSPQSNHQSMNMILTRIPELHEEQLKEVSRVCNEESTKREEIRKKIDETRRSECFTTIMQGCQSSGQITVRGLTVNALAIDFVPNFLIRLLDNIPEEQKRYGLDIYLEAHARASPREYWDLTIRLIGITHNPLFYFQYRGNGKSVMRPYDGWFDQESQKFMPVEIECSRLDRSSTERLCYCL